MPDLVVSVAVVLFIAVSAVIVWLEFRDVRAVR